MNYECECHVTCYVKDAQLATSVALKFGWTTSEIARDPLLGDRSFFYLTLHGSDYATVARRMRGVCQELQSRDVEVIRMKIELIIFDTKTSLYPKNDTEAEGFVKAMGISKRAQAYHNLLGPELGAVATRLDPSTQSDMPGAGLGLCDDGT